MPSQPVARNDALGVFLRDRRARADPAQAGLPEVSRRRVPGLRREEVAQLAQLSVDYYSRLEQGRQRTASAAVLHSVARALGLTEDERLHLFALAGVADDAPPASADSAALARIRGLLTALGSTPAMAVGPFVDIVDANPAASALFTDFSKLPPARRNGLRWILLADEARERYGPEWEDASIELIGMLRLDAGRFPGNQRLAEIVAELERCSPLFRKLWSQQAVASWRRHRKTLMHPAFGSMGFTNEFITVHSAPEVSVVVMIPDDLPRFNAVLDPPG